MFSRIKLTNFAIFANLDWPNHAAMNVIIGENDTGKSHLLKILYVIGRSLNIFQKTQDGPSPKDWYDCFISKYKWTFNDFFLVNIQKPLKNQDVILESNIGNGSFVYKRSIKDKSGEYHYQRINTIGRTIFLPPKEILTAMSAIEATRQKIEIASFDDTYLDLIEDFRTAPTYGKIEPELVNILNKIKKIIDNGEIIEKGMEFVFKRGNEVYSMSQTAEGFKKIGILSRLILNRTLTKGSILLVDEPEANLHPKAIIAMADTLFELSLAGIQVYAATHSYFFLKRMEQRARMNDTFVCLADLRRSADGVNATFHDLRHEIPDNPILIQSEYLLNEDIRLDWGP